MKQRASFNLLFAFGMGICGACGGDESNPAPPASAEVQGTFIDTYIFEGGEETVPRDPSAILISAWVLQPNLSYKKYPGTLSDDGKIDIPGVPQGAYFLRLQTPTSDNAVFYRTEARNLALGQFYASRPDVENIVSAPTEIIFNISGFNPWQDGDGFELYSLGAGIYGLPYFSSLNLGATSLDNAPFDAAELLPSNLIDGSRGDLLYMTQFSSKMTGTIPYRSVSKVMKPPPFTMIDGAQVSVGGVFEDVPQAKVQVSFERSQFAALAKAVHPSAGLAMTSLYFYAETGGPTRVTNSIPPGLLDHYGIADEMSDFSAEFDVGNPFPSAWTPIASASVTYTFDAILPGTSMNTPLRGAALCSQIMMGTGTLSFSPMMHPVQDIQVNGKSTAAALKDVGLAPEIRWSAPAVGAPKTYKITVREIDPNAPPGKTVATIYTPQTSVVIPDNVFQTGKYYYLRIAGLINAVDLTTRDDVGEYGCWIEALTQVIEP